MKITYLDLVPVSKTKINRKEYIWKWLVQQTRLGNIDVKRDAFGLQLEIFDHAAYSAYGESGSAMTQLECWEIIVDFLHFQRIKEKDAVSANTTSLDTHE